MSYDTMTTGELYDEYDRLAKITGISDYKTLAFAMKMANRSDDVDQLAEVARVIMKREYESLL